jgi:hypothetical protein
MAEEPTNPPEVPATPAPLPEIQPAERIQIVVPAPERESRPTRVVPGLVQAMVYAVAIGNIVVLWLARGVYVCGLDLFGATAGVIALNEQGFSGAVHHFTQALLSQRGRPVSTGDETFLFGLVPGLLNSVAPWLLWSHFLGFVLFVASAAWAARRLRLPRVLVCACIVASPALTSFAIVGFPFLASAAVPFALALGYVFPESQKRAGIIAVARDVVVFGLITFVAFNGYQGGQVFFVVPAIAALTLPQLGWTRRLSWLAGSGVIAWLVYTNQASPTLAALDAVPHDPLAAVVEGAQRVAQRYLVDWYIDFPALLCAAVISLFVLRRHRLFWVFLLGALFFLCSLSAFQFNGALLGPRRFMPFLFVASLAVATALSERSSGRRARTVIAVLIATGLAYTSYRTVAFATEKKSDELRDYNQSRVYSLPYAYSGVDMQIWRDRIHDARIMVDALRQGNETHVFFYGFSVLAEDGVNPQVFISRLLLPLGYRRFRDRTVFFDHQDHNLIHLPFSVLPVATVPAVMPRVPTPFYLHVKEPEYSAASIVAKYLNRARVTPVDLGLTEFRSYRVDAFEAPGPVPIPPLPAMAAIAQSDLRDGLCRTAWRQDVGGFSPLVHWFRTLPQHLDIVLNETRTMHNSKYYIDVARRRGPSIVNESTTPGSNTYLRGYLWNPGTDVLAHLALTTDDEVAVVINGQVIVESLEPKPANKQVIDVSLPPGLSDLQIFYHKYPSPTRGTLAFIGTDRDGQPLQWRCPANFGS